MVKIITMEATAMGIITKFSGQARSGKLPCHTVETETIMLSLFQRATLHILGKQLAGLIMAL